LVVCGAARACAARLRAIRRSHQPQRLPLVARTRDRPNDLPAGSWPAARRRAARHLSGRDGVNLHPSTLPAPFLPPYGGKGRGESPYRIYRIAPSKHATSHSTLRRGERRPPALPVSGLATWPIRPYGPPSAAVGSADPWLQPWGTRRPLP